MVEGEKVREPSCLCQIRQSLSTYDACGKERAQHLVSPVTFGEKHREENILSSFQQQAKAAYEYNAS